MQKKIKTYPFDITMRDRRFEAMEEPQPFSNPGYLP